MAQETGTTPCSWREAGSSCDFYWLSFSTKLRYLCQRECRGGAPQLSSSDPLEKVENFLPLEASNRNRGHPGQQVLRPTLGRHCSGHCVSIVPWVLPSSWSDSEPGNSHLTYLLGKVPSST